MTRVNAVRRSVGAVAVAGVVIGASAASAAGCPNEALRGNLGSALPDCRAYEQASPVDKNGNDVGVGLSTQTTFVAAADGSGVAYETLGSLPGALGATTINGNLSRRGGTGWTTQPMVPPQSPRASSDFPGFQFFTPNLRQAVVRTPPGSSLATGDTSGAVNLYLRDNDDASYETLSSRPLSGQVAASAVSYVFAGASTDLRHILFESSDALTPDAPPTAQAFGNLYEWVDGQVRLATILPDESPAPQGGAAAGVGGASSLTQSIVHAISDDGSRIVFGTPIGSSPDGPQLYVREDGQHTVEASASQRTVLDTNPSTPPTFWGATADGSQVFFTSTAALTDDTPLGATSLYRFDVDTGELTDLTVNTNSSAPGPAQVQGVLGISDNGASIYFVDSVQYLPGQGDAGSSKLYLWHDGAIRFVANDPGVDATAFEANHKTSRVTPDGRHVIFMSSNPLTGYDNTDATTGQPDSEVFLYDAAADTLTCTSCRPDGSRPQGPSTLPKPPLRALRNQQRGVTDDGRRVFFDSRDALVPADVNGKADVYEYESGALHLISTGASSDDSYLGSASASGDDVFFVTREQLVAADGDANLDVYDARLGGGFADAPPARPCAGDGCQGAATDAPDAPAPASPSVVGDGNAPPGTPMPPTFRVATLSKSARQTAGRTGSLTLSVRVSEGGILKARASRQVGARTVTAGSAQAHVPRAGTAVLRLRLATSTRTALAHKAKVKLSVRVSFSRVPGAKNVTLELQR
jgi:hypothetical protein